jgi:two-component system chemotaxis response regulator CheB
MRVLVVDDSIVYRMAISQALENVSGIEIVGSVSNGQLAVDKLKQDSNIDVVTLDMEMPVMDGMQAIEEIRKFNKKVIIIVFSSVTLKGAEKTIEALNKGANDFVTKEEVAGSASLSIDSSLEMISKSLLPKINAFSKVIGKSRFSGSPGESVGAPAADSGSSARVATGSFMDQKPLAPKMILIGCSTGGPEALSTLVKGINKKCTVPILAVQHMPPLFTKKLADMLNALTPHVHIKEAVEGEVVEPGVMYIAPGDYHMRLTRDGKLEMDQGEKVSYVRPSATVLFESAAKYFDSQMLCLTMTGMGDDGAAAVKSLLNKNTYIYAQDEATSIVWGMPGAIVKAYPDATLLPLESISDLLNSVFERI